MFTNVKFDKDNNILSKGYTKGKDAYNVYYNTEGDIISEAYKHNKIANNIVEYNKKLEPTDIMTTEKFDLETAKGLKSEASKLWEQFQYGGVNDQIPYVHYKIIINQLIRIRTQIHNNHNQSLSQKLSQVHNLNQILSIQSNQTLHYILINQIIKNIKCMML